jgi:glycerol uptake facilitator protein
VNERGSAAYVAEFIGTFALVFFVTAVVSIYHPPQEPAELGQVSTTFFQDFAVIGLVHILVLFMLIQTLAVISGAHFNPAITAALTVIREIEPRDAAVYIAVQLAGGTLGALLTKALLSDEGKRGTLPGTEIDYGATHVTAVLNGHILPGMFAEAIGTFFLVWAVVGVAVNPSAIKDWAGLAIGGTLGFLVMVIGPMTGGSFNPARSFGPALVSGEFGGADEFLLVYVLAPVVGGVLAAVGYFYLFILPGKRPAGMEPVG